MTASRKTFTYLLFLLTFYISFPVFSYQGEEEVERVFSKIKDLHNPTLEEYKQIQEFLRHGKREYLAPFSSIKNHSSERHIGRSIRLVSERYELPIFEIDKLAPLRKVKTVFYYIALIIPLILTCWMYFELNCVKKDFKEISL